MNTDTPSLPPRDPAGHKGTFGTVCVVGGQAASPRVMIGGPALSARAALRAGAGLAVLAVPAPLMASALVIAPGATGLALPIGIDRVLRPSAAARILDDHLPRIDCLAVGPGWGDGTAQQQILVRLLGRAGPPMVIDADAINAMAALREVHGDLRAPVVLTPHPGEYHRLAGSLGIEADPVEPGRRADAAEQLARRLGCVVVLKGAGTVITDGVRTAVNGTGNAALATAGTGDVLTGIIAGLIAQFMRPEHGAVADGPRGLGLFECARLGVHLHGLAADQWAGEHGEAGLTAEDLITLLPDAMHEMRRGSR